MNPAIAAALIVAAYLLGTFPSAILVARAAGVDITSVGSGNPGAANITRNLGWKKGVWVFVLDGMKGLLASAVALGLDGRQLGYAMGAAAIIGHCYPVTRRFRGGKGVATGGGVFAVLTPVLFPVLVVTWIIVSRVTKKAALASIVTVIGLPVGVALSGRERWEIPAACVLCVLIVVRHTSNIRRMLSRSEHSI